MFSSIRYSAANENQVRVGVSAEGKRSDPIELFESDPQPDSYCEGRIPERCRVIVFPSPHLMDQPISTVKTAWKATLRRAGVPHFPIYNLRHVFCTRLSGVAADAVVQRAMRHTSPETKRRYQLGMTDQVRQAMEKSNQKAYGRRKVLRFYDVWPDVKKKVAKAVCSLLES